ARQSARTLAPGRQAIQALSSNGPRSRGRTSAAADAETCPWPPRPRAVKGAGPVCPGCRATKLHKSKLTAISANLRHLFGRSQKVHEPHRRLASAAQKKYRSSFKHDSKPQRNHEDHPQTNKAHDREITAR